jgi:hypothetical protein
MPKSKTKSQPQKVTLSQQLGTNFFSKLKQISASLGIKPEDLLAIMTFESSLNPSSTKKDGPTGLIQFMPKTLKGVGWQKTPEEFSKTTGEEQLQYVKKYVQQNMNSLNGGKPFASLGQFYVSNLFPVALKLPGVKNQDAGTAILEANPAGVRGKDGVLYSKKYFDVGVKSQYTTVKAEANAFNANAAMAKIRPGKAITYGDIQNKMEAIKKNPIYLKAVEELKKAPNQPVTTPSAPAPAPAPAAAPKEANLPQNVNLPSNVNRQELEQFLTEYNIDVTDPSSNQFSQQLLDEAVKEYLQASTLDLNIENNNILIKVNSNNLIDSMECASVLANALDEELIANSFVHHNSDQIEIGCNIDGPKALTAMAVKQIADCVVDSFNDVLYNKNQFNKIKINFLLNKTSSYQETSLESLQSNHRKFLLKIS